MTIAPRIRPVSLRFASAAACLIGVFSLFALGQERGFDPRIVPIDA